MRSMWKNLASLLEVKGAKPSPTPSSRATGRGQRDVLELLTAAEATVFRRGTRIALYLGPDRFDLQFATKELAQDMQTRYLWHQQALREGRFNVVRCGTKENPSDLGTKVLEREAMALCMSKLTDSHETKSSARSCLTTVELKKFFAKWMTLRTKTTPPFNSRRI